MSLQHVVHGVFAVVMHSLSQRDILRPRHGIPLDHKLGVEAGTRVIKRVVHGDHETVEFRSGVRVALRRHVAYLLLPFGTTEVGYDRGRQRQKRGCIPDEFDFFCWINAVCDSPVVVESNAQECDDWMVANTQHHYGEILDVRSLRKKFYSQSEVEFTDRGDGLLQTRFHAKVIK
jgi:hypothetical protein